MGKKASEIQKERIKEIEDKALIKRIFTALIYTILAFFISFWGVFSLFMRIFSNHSQEVQAVYLMTSFFIVTVFSIILCTLTILDKLK